MLLDAQLAKRYLGAKFGYGETLQDGIYAVPVDSSKGKAFMRLEIINGKLAGSNNFYLYWDESLNFSWYDVPKPKNLTESKFSKAFRLLENAR